MNPSIKGGESDGRRDIFSLLLDGLDNAIMCDYECCSEFGEVEIIRNRALELVVLTSFH